MQLVLFWIKWAFFNYKKIVSALIVVLTALIAFFLLIPGDQPEAFLQKILDMIR